MTATQFLAATNLPTISADQLAVAYGFCAAKALAATTTTGRTRAMNQREAVRQEAARRGLIIRRSTDGGYMCGHPAAFEPIR